MTNRIRELREEKGLRQSDLAKETGIDQRTISNYETGRSNPDSFALIKLADFFHVSIDYLVGRTQYDLLSAESKQKKIEDIQNALEQLKKML